MKRSGFKRKTPSWATKPVVLPDVDCECCEPTCKPLPKLPPIPKKTPKSQAIRKAAKGRPCMIRLPGCDGGGETTVLCHYRLAGYCGTSMKPPDEFGAFGCYHCHSIADGRLPRPEGYSKNDVLLAFAEAVMRSQHLIRMDSDNS